MTVHMIPMREDDASPLDLEHVSPELILVDPTLAQAARALLPDVLSATLPAPRSGHPAHSPELIALANACLEPALDEPTRRPRGFRSRVGIATGLLAAAAVLVLLDVRVQVGRTPASAEGPVVDTSIPITPAPQTGIRPQAPAGGGSVPAVGPVVPRARQFAWAPVAKASGYHVEFFRGPQRVFVTDTTRPGVSVPARWKLDGRARSLEPGDYRWYVWPVIGGRRASQAVVRATLVVPVS